MVVDFVYYLFCPSCLVVCDCIKCLCLHGVEVCGMSTEIYDLPVTKRLLHVIYVCMYIRLIIEINRESKKLMQ